MEPEKPRARSNSVISYHDLKIEESTDPSTPILGRKKKKTVAGKLKKQLINAFSFGPDKPLPSATDLLDIWFRSLAEFFGTFIFVLFGCGAVCGGAILGIEVGIWQVAIVWGLGLALAIYLTAGISGGHLNPAVTLALTILRNDDNPMSNLAPYIMAQIFGGFIAGVVTWAVYDPFLTRFEQLHNVTRGMEGSQISAAVFSGYYPNPGAFPFDDVASEALVSAGRAFMIELLGTLVLAMVIFVLTSKEHRILGDKKTAAPMLIGLTLAVLICEYGIFTECSLNPARDFGPRLAANVVGWGRIAVPGPRNGFWVYLTAPLVGAILGGIIAEFGFIKALIRFNKRIDDEEKDL